MWNTKNYKCTIIIKIIASKVYFQNLIEIKVLIIYNV